MIKDKQIFTLSYFESQTLNHMSHATQNAN